MCLGRFQVGFPVQTRQVQVAPTMPNLITGRYNPTLLLMIRHTWIIPRWLIAARGMTVEGRHSFYFIVMPSHRD